MKPFTGDRQELIDAVRDALYASKIISYAQGFVQLGVAAKLYDWNLNFGDIASIWRGGCIIRAQFLNRITEAYRRNPALKNLILDPYFTEIIVKTQAHWRYAVQTAIGYGVAAPAFSAALSYYDSYRSARLPANLLQAQRDYFGAHTYERVDKPAGSFSTRNGSPISSKTAENSVARKFFSEISRGRTNRAAPLFIRAGGRTRLYKCGLIPPGF